MTSYTMLRIMNVLDDERELLRRSIFTVSRRVVEFSRSDFGLKEVN